MKRREFLAASALLGLAPLSAVSKVGGREYYELQKYHLINRSHQERFNAFMRTVLVPALNRIGIAPVGVFSVTYGSTSPTVYMLLPHKSADSVVRTVPRLMADSEYVKEINTPISKPSYVRMESLLMAAFEGMPRIEMPPENRGIFELRIYESHSVKAGQKKIEMFNDGGEIQIFRDTGLNPVFFGETIIGPQMPNLTYMLAFEDMAERDRNWSVFRNSPAWKKLSADQQYKDTVSNITDVILRPFPFSQI